MRPEILLRKKWIESWPGKVSLIEPTVGSTPGFPDAFAASRSSSGLVEFKALDEQARFTFEPTQRLWLIENIPIYSRVAIVAMNKHGFYTIPAKRLTRKGMPLTHAASGFPFLPWDRAIASLSYIDEAWDE